MNKHILPATICLLLTSATSAFCAVSAESVSILNELKARHSISKETVKTADKVVVPSEKLAAKVKPAAKPSMDVINLTNGDRISGKLIDVFNKTVRIKAYATDAISIPFAQISSISTIDEYQVILDEGTILAVAKAYQDATEHHLKRPELD